MNCPCYLKGQEDLLPNISAILAPILAVPRHLRAQPTSAVKSAAAERWALATSRHGKKSLQFSSTTFFNLTNSPVKDEDAFAQSAGSNGVQGAVPFRGSSRTQ